jgi:hypothetical protein
MKKLLLFTSLLGLWGASGCASLQSVSVTNIPSERGRPVEATADNTAFLGIHFDNDFADELTDELRSQCPDGKVTGIYSKYESTWYVVVQNRSVTARGYCVRGEQAAAPAPKPAAPAVPAAPLPPAPAAPPAAEPVPMDEPTAKGAP